MKRILFAPLLIALSLLISGAEAYFVNTSTDACLSLLSEADERMSNMDSIGALSAAERLERRFQGQTGLFNIFMYHSEVGHIASDLAMMRQYARTGAASDFLASSACARRELEAVRHAKALTWDNIF